MFGKNFRKTSERFWVDWRVILKKQFGEVLGDFKEHPMIFRINF